MKNYKQQEYVFNIITDYIEEKTGMTDSDLDYCFYNFYDIDGLDENEILLSYTCKYYYVELYVYYKSNSSNNKGDEIFTIPEEELEKFIAERAEIDEDTIQFKFYDYDKKNFKRVVKAVIDYIHDNI